MKSFFRKLFFYVGILWLSPLIIPFQVANNRELILGDVRRWVELLGWEKRADSLQLLALCLEAKEFRNLYYCRLFQGGSFSRFFMYILRFFYRESSYLFLDSSCSIGKGLFIQHGFSQASNFAVVANNSLVAASNAFIVYSSGTGHLFYNQNGSAAGLGTGDNFAVLTGNPPKLP